MIHADTVAYFAGGRAFGHAQAKPATTESDGRTWDDDQLDGAASALAAGDDVHPDLLAALGRRYLDLVQDEATRAEEVRTLGRQLTALRNELIGERSESVRLAQLHAEASQLLALVTRQRDQAQYERTLALHQRAGTTPVGIQIALDRAARDTEVGK